MPIREPTPVIFRKWGLTFAAQAANDPEKRNADLPAVVFIAGGLLAAGVDRSGTVSHRLAAVVALSHRGHCCPRGSGVGSGYHFSPSARSARDLTRARFDLVVSYGKKWHSRGNEAISSVGFMLSLLLGTGPG
jgi:hypothetical protein